MRKLKLFFACLLMAVLSIGQMWGATADVTYDFTGSDWSVSDGTLTDGSVSFTGEGSANFKMNTGYFILGKTNAYINFPTYSKAVEKIVVTGRSGASAAVGQNIYVGSNEVSTATTGATGSNTYNIASGYQAAGTVYTLKVTSNHNTQITKIEIFYKAETPAGTCATPTFSPEAGAVLSGTTVTLSTTTAEADIYYTMGASPADPTTSSTKYLAPISITEATTIKAIAVKAGLTTSSVASASYTIIEPLTTMQAIFEAATTTETAQTITFNSAWVVSGVKSDGKQAYLTDGTKGLILYSSSNMGLAVGNTLSGTKECTLVLYNGAAELKNFNTTGLTKGTASVPAVQELDAAGIEALSGVNTGSLIKISGECTNPSGTTYKIAGVQLYNQLFSYSAPTAGKNYNCTGVYLYYKKGTDAAINEILPRSAADVEEIVTKYTVTYEASPANGSLAIYDGSTLIASGSAVNEGTVLTIETTPAEGYKLKEVQVNGSTYTETTLELTEDVVIAAEFELNEAPLVETYVLSENGVEASHLNGEHVGDKVNLPLTAASCSKVFRGWDADENCATEPTYAPGAEITLAANNKFYAVYAEAHVVTPTDHALGSGTFNGTNEGGNTASEGYTFSKSTKGESKAGYIQDSGTKDETIIFVQIKAESQIINEEPSAIIVTAHLAAGSDKDPLDYPVYAVLVDADGNNVGDPVALATAVPKAGDDFSANLPTANYASVRGVKISHMKEDSWNVRYHSMSFKYQTGGTTYDNYSTECQAQVATPVISGVTADGVYDEGKEISITCATDGATIYYAVDSDEEPSTEYTGAFTVDTDGAHTVKAKAVKTDMVDSEIASVSFTINLPVVLSTIDQIFAAAKTAGSTAADANIAFGNWVVSGVSTNGKNVFVTDGTKGFIIFDNGGEMGFAVGDVLSGTVACKVQLYKGAAELTTLSSTTEGLNIAKEGVITPAVKAISALDSINTGAPIIINSVQFDGTNLSDGANEIKPYNSLFAYDALEIGTYYNVTGIYLQFDATKEILPRSAADIEEKNLQPSGISYSPAEETIEVGDSWSAPTFNNEHNLTVTFSGNNDAVATVNTTTGEIALAGGTGTAVITASFAGDATYAATNVTYTITVNPASVTENVVILAVYDTKYYAMSTTIPGEAFTAIEVAYDGSQVTVNSAEDKAAIQWTKKTSGDNTTFQTKGETPMYMKGTSGGAAMSLNANVCNWSWDGTNEYYYIGSRSFFYQNGVGFKNYATSNFNKSGYSGKASVIVIDPANIVISSKVDPALAYTPNELEIEAADIASWSAPAFSNTYGVSPITYTSNKSSVATVDENGVIALAGGYGTAVITASFAGNDDYLLSEATYTITVIEPADVCDGTDDFLDTEDKSSPTSYSDRSTPNGWTAVNAGYKLIDEKAYWMINGKTTAYGVITSPELSDGIASLKFRYANTNSESNGVSVKIEIKQGGDVVKEYTLTKANSEVVQNTVYTELIEDINVAGTFQIVITNLCPSNNTGNKDRVSIGRFCWTGYTAPTPGSYETVRTGLTPGNYYTICYPKAMTDVQGATLWSFIGKDANMAYLQQETAATIEAGKPYILYATASTVTAVLGDETNAPGANEAIHGTFNNLTQDQLDNLATVAGNDLYLVIGNQLCKATGYANDGITPLTGNSLPAQRAFVVLGEIPAAPAQMPAHVRSMPLHKDTATGMDALNATDAPVKMVIDGQLFIIRGEKMYDATGRLVK